MHCKSPYCHHDGQRPH